MQKRGAGRVEHDDRRGRIQRDGAFPVEHAAHGAALDHGGEHARGLGRLAAGEVLVMLETVDVLIHAVHPIPVGQAAHRVLQRHRPHIVRGDQLVDQGKHVLVQREWPVRLLHGFGQRHHGALAARQDLLPERAAVRVAFQMGRVRHRERVKVVALAGGHDLTARYRVGDGLPFALTV